MANNRPVTVYRSAKQGIGEDSAPLTGNLGTSTFSPALRSVDTVEGDTTYVLVFPRSENSDRIAVGMRLESAIFDRTGYRVAAVRRSGAHIVVTASRQSVPLSRA